MTAPFSYGQISQVRKPVELTRVEGGPTYGNGWTINQYFWRKDGYLVLPNMVSEDLIEDYSACWIRENQNLGGPRWGGWPDCTPYMRHDEIKNLALNRAIDLKLEELIGEKMGIHLNLTGWKSTERDWHSDAYLNPPEVGGHYAAIWIALEDIQPDSGPFEFVPGSHHWPTIRQDLLFKNYDESLRLDPKWPWLTQDAVARACHEEIARRGSKTQKFLGKKGDVLIWHSGLLHRGSKPERSGARRRSFIAHFSAINRRPDFPKAAQWRDSGWFFPIENSGPV